MKLGIILGFCLVTLCQANRLAWLFATDGAGEEGPSKQKQPMENGRQSPRDLSVQDTQADDPAPPSDISPSNLENLRVCPNDRVCKKGQYCDQHYNVCRDKVALNQPCRSDKMCHKGVCMFGYCEKSVTNGEEGARCRNSHDCNPGLCCARRHGHKICQKSLQEGDKCYVPEGGLDFAINETCPCGERLRCQHHLGRPSAPLKFQPTAKGDSEKNSLEGMKCLPISDAES